jgi:hypothetical protein
MSTQLLETCRGFKWTYHRRNCASSWSPTRIIQRCTVRKKHLKNWCWYLTNTAYRCYNISHRAADVTPTLTSMSMPARLSQIVRFVCFVLSRSKFGTNLAFSGASLQAVRPTGKQATSKNQASLPYRGSLLNVATFALCRLVYHINIDHSAGSTEALRSDWLWQTMVTRCDDNP